MPKLLIFAPCERVIIDQNNVTSIFTILQELRFEAPEPPPDPEGRVPVAPIKWDVLSLWMRTEGDEPGTVYETRFALVDPTGNAIPGFAASVEFTFLEGKTNHRVVTTLLGFPIHPEGRYLVRLWLHEKGEPEGGPVSEFPILVVRAQPKD